MTQSLLFVGNFLSKSSQNCTYEELLAKKIQQSGQNVLMVSSYKNKAMRLLDMVLGVIRFRNRYQFAHISVFSGNSFVWAETTAWLVKKMKRRLILSLHGGNLPDFSKCYPKRMHSLLSLADAVIAPSNYLKDKLQPFSKKDIHVIPNAVEISRYSYRLRTEVSPRLIWLRAFHSIYNPTLMPIVIDLVKKNVPDVMLTMIGPDKGDGSLDKTRELAIHLQVEQNIKIIPGISKEKVSEYLNQADIFINSTNIDNTPVSVIEAMACGLCVISTNVGGVPYLLANGKEGLLIPPNDPRAMADAIIKLINDAPLAARLSENARTKSEIFDWPQTLQKWETLFGSLN